MKRRTFIRHSSLLSTAALFSFPTEMLGSNNFQKKRIAMVGTGIRGASFWGKRLTDQYADKLEFVGLCDSNAGRVAYAKKHIKTNCPLFDSFDEMLQKTKPAMVIVTTDDSSHDQFIIKALDAGCDVITEKPITTDEIKLANILAAEKRSGKKIIVGFNYRHSPHMTKIKELLQTEKVGKITSVDFHWYLNVYHGADYFRRWHAYTAKSGSLWVHKATHHFDLLNWWLDADPVEVHAYGSLDNYGKNGSYRGKSCRSCEHKAVCPFYWDISKDGMMANLYTNNEHLDGYIRDSCVFREDIDIYDKMSAQIIYANGVTVNYSLTTYSPYEGWKIAFNGKTGRIDSWQDIPFMKEQELSQKDRHEMEMKQDKTAELTNMEQIVVMKNFTKNPEIIQVPMPKSGHGGGDKRMQDLMFDNPTNENPYQVMAGSRDAAMSVLIGIAARKSIQLKRSVLISELTNILPQQKRPL